MPSLGGLQADLSLMRRTCLSQIGSVVRFVIPAEAGIQPGFRLALRLAGMTMLPKRPSARVQL